MFAVALQVSNRLKSEGNFSLAVLCLASPIYIQLAWWAAWAVYGRRRARAEISAGIMIGLVTEGLVLGALILFASLAHY